MPSAIANAELAHNPPGGTGPTASIDVPFEDIEMLVMEKIKREVIEEIEGIDPSTPRGQWILFTILSAANSAKEDATRRWNEFRERL